MIVLIEERSEVKMWDFWEKLEVGVNLGSNMGWKWESDLQGNCEHVERGDQERKNPGLRSGGDLSLGLRRGRKGRSGARREVCRCSPGR